MEGNLVDDRISKKRDRDDDKGSLGRLEKRPSGLVVIDEYNGDEMINGVKYEEEKPGLFNQLITNLVNSPRPDQHQPEAEPEKVNGEECNGDGDGGEVVEDEKDGGGNIIDNIVARLPRTLSEDTAPATDEASILIHSIIHD